jgi:sugar lactone lactonase YvrE
VASGGPRNGSITRFKRRSNGALRYKGCFSNGGAHGCRTPTHDSLKGASSVAVSPDGESVYATSRDGITAFERSASGALAYRGCFVNRGHLGCQAGTNNTLRQSWDLAVSPDGNSLYVASSSAITDFRRGPNGALTYGGCVANRGSLGCQDPVHDSLRFPRGLALSPDGASVYVASTGAHSVTHLERAADGALSWGGCFANQGARGCEVPIHDSLRRALDVAVSADDYSVYVVAPISANAITLFDRESPGR